MSNYLEIAVPSHYFRVLLDFFNLVENVESMIFPGVKMLDTVTFP